MRSKILNDLHRDLKVYENGKVFIIRRKDGSERPAPIRYNFSGYERVTFQGHAVSVARLVWQCFVGNIPYDKEIDHINGVKTDNRLENLRVVSHKENCNNENTKNKGGIGVKIVDTITGQAKTYECFKDAGKDIGVTHATIRYAINHNTLIKKRYRVEAMVRVTYTYDDIMDEIGYNESFAGNEGCMDAVELRDYWIYRMYCTLAKMQGTEEVTICEY